MPVRIASSCPVETLQAAACVLQLRPCESRIHETRLCKEDCLELMSKCVDWSAMTGPHTAATLCAKMTPNRADAPCVSLKPFLEDSQEENTALVPDDDITTPCKSNPCQPGQVCIASPSSPRIYECKSACTLGEMSRQQVPLGSWIQIPRSGKQSCWEICQCTARGFEKCRELNCMGYNSCYYQDRLISHRSTFYLSCNPCVCLEGELTCSKYSNCGELRIPSLPCECAAHYVPVCGRTGVTHASACLARCAGLQPHEIEFGRCTSKDACKENPCGENERCVPKPRICLAPSYKPCKQYECVPRNCNLRDNSTGPVCDKDNHQHSSICAMTKSGASLGYRGPCLRGCDLRGPVCGINGEVYAHECAAWAARTAVDYSGPCVAVGLIGDQSKPRCGESVQCPPLASGDCIGVTPPGACCPVCAGAARLYYSRKQASAYCYFYTL